MSSAVRIEATSCEEFLSRLFIVISSITAFLGRRGQPENLNSENCRRRLSYIGKLNDANAIVVVTSQGVCHRHRQQSAGDAQYTEKHSSRHQAAGALCHHHAKPVITSAARRSFRRRDGDHA